LSATMVVHLTKVLMFCRPRTWLFVWSNYAIFHGTTTETTLCHWFKKRLGLS